MPVNADQFAMTPYTSTVPITPVPPSEISGQTRPDAPLAGQFGRKGTGAMLIGDSLLKGFMLGHQQKEQRKQAQAQATINAADAATEGAYQQYQAALTKAGGDDKNPEASAAYQSYVKTFQASKQAKAQFVLPDKTQKGKKSALGSDTDPVKSPDDKKKKTASAGFNNIKDFFEANPHIVPQIALMTMQPKPPGLSPEGQQQSQSLESGKMANEETARRLQNEKTYQTGFTTFAHLSPEEIAALPPDAKKNYEAWQNARAALAPMKYSGATRLYKLSNGKNAWLYPEEAAQNYPDAEAISPGSQVRAGSDAELEDKYLQSIGVTRDAATADQLAAATQYARTAKISNTATTSTSTTNPQGDRTTTTRRTASPGGIGKPPAASGQTATTSGGVTKPPVASVSPTGQGKQGVTPPPQSSKTTKPSAKTGTLPPPGYKPTALTASVTRQAVTKQKEGYRKAEAQYQKDIAAADKAFAAAQKTTATTGDQSVLQAAQKAKDDAYARAKIFLESAKQSVADEYDAAVKSIGGTPGGQQQGSVSISAPDGNTYTFPDQKSADAFKQAAGIQ